MGMIGPDWLWLGVFVGGAALVSWLAAHPGFFRMLARLSRPVPAPSDLTDDDLPSVTVVIADGPDTESRVASALAADYPTDRFDVLVAGPTDSFDDPRVRSLPTADAASLGAILPRARGDVVLVSAGDDYGTARELAARFLDPAVCAAWGNCVLTAPDGPDQACETFVKLSEGPVGALLGTRRGLYAVRRPAYAPAPCDARALAFA
jgi:hypothetical protein